MPHVKLANLVPNSTVKHEAAAAATRPAGSARFNTRAAKAPHVARSPRRVRVYSG